MFSSKATLPAYVIVLSLTLSSGAEGRNASILVFGRNGSEVYSTVQMLLGSFTPPEPTETDSSNSSAFESVITEFVVPIPGEFGSFLRIVEVEGVADSPEEDAYVQASLKTFLTHPEGLNSLNSQKPTAVLIVSPFDKTPSQYEGNQSPFAQMLRRIADVEKSVYGDEIPDINILLFTRLMAETKSAQRSPRRKLESFRATAIEHVDGIPPDIVTLVGENKGEDYGLTLNADGTYRLPNRQFYPTNVFEAVANLADSNGVSSEKSVVETFAALRLNSNGDDTVKALRVPFTVAPGSTAVANFTRTIVRIRMGDIDDNEVHAALQMTYESLTDVNLRRRITTTVPTLQAFLQSSNITRFSDLPSTRQNKAKLFISLPVLINSDVVSFLQEALNFTMSPFKQSLTVGYGYNLLTDEILPPTSIPFAPAEMNTWAYSSIGYLLPTFLSCHQLPYSQHQEHTHSADSFEQSVVQRQTFLDYPNKDAFNVSTFDGHLRLGFNVKPSADDVPAFSFVRELQLNERTELSEEFKNSVRLLTPLNSTNRSSEKEWRNFFERWGTHVVSSGFLGGLLHATLISNNIRVAYQNANETSSVVAQIKNIPQFEEKLVYSVTEGDGKPTALKLPLLNQFSQGEWKDVFDKWESSLPYDPVGLAYQMELIPMSSLIGRVNETMAQPAATALDLLLRGNLQVRRDRKKPRAPSLAPTQRPTISTTAAPAGASPIIPQQFDQRSIIAPTYDWDVLESFFNSSVIGRENEMYAKIWKERQQMMDEIEKQEQELLQRRQGEYTQQFQNQMDFLDQQHSQRMLEIQRQISETNLAMQEMLQKQKQTRERQEGNQNPLWQ